MWALFGPNEVLENTPCTISRPSTISEFEQKNVSDMEFVQKFTPLDFQVKNSTPSILPNFNSFSKKKNTKNE